MDIKKLFLANKKRIAINTALVESHCQYNPDIRDIVTKYASHAGVITEQNLAATMRWIHARPLEFIDAACGWFWVNVSRTYKGKAISWIFDERHEIKVKVGRSFNNN